MSVIAQPDLIAELRSVVQRIQSVDLDRKIGARRRSLPTPNEQPTRIPRCRFGVQPFRSGVEMPRLMNTDYQKYLSSPEWRAKRQQRLEHDNHRCFRCTATERLEIHHITYERAYRERLTDLITLCADCHAKDHGRDPSLPAELPAQFYRDAQIERARLLLAQEDIAEAAGVDLTSYFEATS